MIDIASGGFAASVESHGSERLNPEGNLDDGATV